MGHDTGDRCGIDDAVEHTFEIADRQNIGIDSYDDVSITGYPAEHAIRLRPYPLTRELRRRDKNGRSFAEVRLPTLKCTNVEIPANEDVQAGIPASPVERSKGKIECSDLGKKSLGWADRDYKCHLVHAALPCEANVRNLSTNFLPPHAEF